MGLRVVAGAIFLSLTVSPARVVSQSPYTIYFYSAETNINNFSSLKAEFDAYLSARGPYRFQPFSDRATFEAFLSRNPRGILLISSWHYRRLSSQFPMEPVLVGLSRNRSTRRRILCAKFDATSLDALTAARIATAASDDFTRTVLREMMGERGVPQSMKLLIVPKDIDALMAVGFGMATAALTTEDSLERLKEINPKLAGLIRPLAASKGTLLPIVAVPKDADDNVQKLVALIEQMGEDQDGKKRLKMLGLDRFKRINESESRLLR